MKQWLKDAVFYEIYPQSFYDTNGDGIGDLKGIIEKLDYIKELGCNALWINPCFDSPFKDAGYDVRDYKLIAPRYGTNADAKALFEAAHAKGIHVLLDLVPGHTSEEHAWFKESSKPEKNEYSDRYIWTDSCFSAGDGMPFIGGETDRNGTYILNFFKCQPALNYGYGKCREKWQMPTDAPGPRATVEAVKDVMRFWLDMGCDGFRVDMASSLVKNDTHHKKYTCAIWRDIAAMLDKEYPEAAQDQPAQNAANGQSNAVHRGVGGNGEHEDAAVGGAQAAVERHGKRTGGGCTNGAAGDNVQRVRGCIGDSALSNKAEAHYIVDHTVAALVRGPLFGEEGGG